ncbi:hypothetical protein [Metabacillus iocasae]|uniref:Uncharacterized protein n=1 Tax=Priestia iocasae TaxID=2291674 RepID=A0ABS2QS98_9BACI|nr:hypothetical protein [Metabacillus iocasae]MBM7702321.1 hypothetical protein [Metabacillus iocasae]
MENWMKVTQLLKENMLFNQQHLFRLWMICLSSVVQKKTSVVVGMKRIQLKEGEFMTTGSEMTEAYNRGLTKNTPARTIWRWLQQLEALNYVTISTTKTHSIVKVHDPLVVEAYDEEAEWEHVQNQQTTDKPHQASNKEHQRDDKPHQASDKESQSHDKACQTADKESQRDDKPLTTPLLHDHQTRYSAQKNSKKLRTSKHSEHPQPTKTEAESSPNFPNDDNKSLSIKNNKIKKNASSLSSSSSSLKIEDSLDDMRQVVKLYLTRRNQGSTLSQNDAESIQRTVELGMEVDELLFTINDLFDNRKEGTIYAFAYIERVVRSKVTRKNAAPKSRTHLLLEYAKEHHIEIGESTYDA